MTIEKGTLNDCWIIKPTLFKDNRGYFYEGFNQKKFYTATQIDFKVKQINISGSSHNVLRGLHFQENPKAQAKLVCCMEGEILDIAVDLRKKSPTYLQYQWVRLSEENKMYFFIPRGMAHGFLVLSNYAKVMYQVDEYYSPEHDSGVNFADKTINIPWDQYVKKPLLSNKDKNLPFIENIQKN